MYKYVYNIYINTYTIISNLSNTWKIDILFVRKLYVIEFFHYCSSNQHPRDYKNQRLHSRQFFHYRPVLLSVSEQPVIYSAVFLLCTVLFCSSVLQTQRKSALCSMCCSWYTYMRWTTKPKSGISIDECYKYYNIIIYFILQQQYIR